MRPPFFYKFFPFNFFLQQHKNIIKSNNKKNNYMNQLLRLPLLNYIQTEKNTYVKEKKLIIIIIKGKTVPCKCNLTKS